MDDSVIFRALHIIREMAKGRHLTIPGGDTYAMGEGGTIGVLRDFTAITAEGVHYQVILGDLTFREICKLVEEHNLVPIPK